MCLFTAIVRNATNVMLILIVYIRPLMNKHKTVYLSINLLYRTGNVTIIKWVNNNYTVKCIYIAWLL